MRTNESSENIVALSDIRLEKQRALSPYGPLKVGLITWQDRETNTANQLAQLSELLNSLESVVENLNYKSFTAYDMLASATENLRATHSAFIEGTGGTEGML